MTMSVKKGYHFTKKEHLQSIFNKGLIPRIGRRSYDVKENSKLLYFAPELSLSINWKDRLYPKISFDELVLLSLNLEDVEFTSRYGCLGDFFTKKTIDPSNISVVEVIDVNSNAKVSLSNILKVIKKGNKNYKLVETKLLEANYDIKNKNNNNITKKLASYEHKKWSNWQRLVHWNGYKNENDELVISNKDIIHIKNKFTLTFDEMDKFYKYKMINTVMKTFYILDDAGYINDICNKSDKLIEKLSVIEHKRINRWAKYMLSCCEYRNSEYIIPKDKYKLWNEEILTSYYDMTSEQQASDNKQVMPILNLVKDLQKEVFAEKNDIDEYEI